MSYPEFVNRLKELGINKRTKKLKVSPNKFYPHKIELETIELLREELDDFGEQLTLASTIGMVRDSIDDISAISPELSDDFKNAVSKIASKISVFNAMAFADYSDLTIGQRYFPTIDAEHEILNVWEKNFMTLCKSANDEIKKKIAAKISDGILTGKNLRSLEIDIKNTCASYSKSKSELIATTEVGKLNTAIARSQSEAAGISYYEWSAAMDGRTRASHAAMDSKICKWGEDKFYYEWELSSATGKRKLVKKSRPKNAYMGAPGTDFRCRCVALPYVPEFEDDYEAERTHEKQEGVVQKHPKNLEPSPEIEILQRKIDILRAADKRHTNRTDVQKQAILNKWEQRVIDRNIGTLKTLDGAINDFKSTSFFDKSLYKKEANVKKIMSDLFDRTDFAVDIKTEYLENVFDRGLLNTFQTGTSGGYKGSSKTIGPIESDHLRLCASHNMFFSKSSGLKCHDKKTIYTKQQLKREEYEKYGHLVDKDKAYSLINQLTWYGNCIVRLKKDNVKDRTTWTYNDSLSVDCQPSRVNNPSSVSFDKLLEKAGKKDVQPVSQSSIHPFDDFVQNNAPTFYIELQYHGKLTKDDIESIVLKKKPCLNNKETITPELAKKYINSGIEIWYITKGVAKKYQP